MPTSVSSLVPPLQLIILGGLDGVAQRPVAPGDKTDHQGIGHTIGRRDLGRVEHAQPATRPGADIEQPATTSHPLHQALDEALDLRDLPAYRLGHLPILAVDPFQ